jgi:hypothetical protein
MRQKSQPEIMRSLPIPKFRSEDNYDINCCNVNDNSAKIIITITIKIEY